MKLKIQQLLAFLISVFTIAFMITLTGAIANKAISGIWYLIGMTISVIVMLLDSKWIDKHFVNGRWI